MTACFRHWHVGYEWETDSELVDHRYFYELDGLGYYTCGLIRNAVAEKLFELSVEFADTDFLDVDPAREGEREKEEAVDFPLSDHNSTRVSLGFPR